MRKLIITDPRNWAALFARVILGLVVFPHGAQKLFGWFGGNGLDATLTFMTQHMNVPYIITILVILIECIGSLFLIAGFLTRIFAFCMFCNFVGIILHSHLHNGFFMNWNMLPDKPEGYEYHLLIIGVSIVLMIFGGGRLSVDAALSKRYSVAAFT